MRPRLPIHLFRPRLARWRMCLLLAAPAASAQTPAPPPQQQATAPAGQELPTPVFRVNVVARSTKAVNYQHRSGATEIDFRGTAILPKGEGRARIESKQGRIEITASFDRMRPAYTAGAEYLTYVLWAVTPEGRARNLGELLLTGAKSKLQVTTELQVFGLIVTAEPYFAVTQPSDVIVMENEIRPDTKGRWDVIDARFEILQRGQYAGTGSAQPPVWSPKIPLELIEARNAVRIGRLVGASTYAKEVFERAERALASAEDYHDRQVGWKPVSMMAREAVQRAEDARVIALARQQEEKLAAERKQAAEREARAKAMADTEAQRRKQAEADRAAMEKAKLDAEATARKALAERAEAEQRQKQLTAEAEAARTRAVAARKESRQRLFNQLRALTDTRDTPRGLELSLPEELFEGDALSGQQEARERLARIAGLLAAYPGLKLTVEHGAAESEGTSLLRASSLRDYLVRQGLEPESMALAPGERLGLVVSGTAITPE